MSQPTIEVRKARLPELEGTETASEAFVVIARECVDQWQSNEALLRSSRAMPHLHQTRVGIRRLRCAFSLFRPALREAPEGADIIHRLRALALPFGTARDLDVLLAGPLVETLKHGQVATLEASRERAHDQVATILGSADWLQMRLDLAAFLNAAPWGLTSDPPIHDVAGAALDKRWRRVVKRGALLAELPAHERHEVRIESKKLRYGCEFFSSLYAVDTPRVLTPKGVELVGPAAFGSVVEELQGTLGVLNDHATADLLLQSVGARAPGLDEEALTAEAVAAYTALAALRPFWR